MKQFVKKLARSLDLEIHRYTPEASDTARLHALLAFHRIDLVLDVGANTGQYARELRDGGYRGRIVSFEPLAAAHRELAVAARGDPDWQVAPPVAIGDRGGMIELNVANNLVSSSVLNMLDSHRDAAPGSEYVGKETVRVVRLDALGREYLGPDDTVFLKVDTQGFESQVVDGASGILPRIHGLQVELSLVPLYESQPLFVDMIRRLEALGYELHAILPGFTDGRSGRMLQADGIFFQGERS